METFFSGTVTVLVTVTVTVEHHFFFLYIYIIFGRLEVLGLMGFWHVQVLLSRKERLGYSLYL